MKEVLFVSSPMLVLEVAHEIVSRLRTALASGVSVPESCDDLAYGPWPFVFAPAGAGIFWEVIFCWEVDGQSESWMFPDIDCRNSEDLDAMHDRLGDPAEIWIERYNP